MLTIMQHSHAERWRRADLEAHVALLRLLPETRIPDTVTDVDGERDEYVGILRSALTQVCAANRFKVLVAK